MDTQKALAHLERFCHQVSKGLTSLTFDERQQLLRLVIERISVENGVARIDAVIPPDQDNLRNRYPETVEGPASVIPEPKPVWFGAATLQPQRTRQAPPQDYARRTNVKLLQPQRPRRGEP